MTQEVQGEIAVESDVEVDSSSNLSIENSDSNQGVEIGIFRRGSVELHFGRVEELYDLWPVPTCIISDGPYGVGGFPGDLNGVEGLVDWYRPHIEAWTNRATAQTTLWFWNTEIGWATVHPTLKEFGWQYRACHVWDKGVGHIAGNANTKTLRKLPVTTEVCVQYVKAASVDGVTLQQWLRSEWKRSGLAFQRANKACGVANAATRKYLTSDSFWYFPPPEAFASISEYANTHGDPAGRPYFSRDGTVPLSAREWSKLRAKFKCPVGATNVWSHPHVGGTERVLGERREMKWKFKSLHGSQKPLRLVSMTIEMCTDHSDVVWEPFGGLCPAAVCSWLTGRRCSSAEVVPEFYNAAVARLNEA